MFTPIELANGIYSVGCRDWDIRDFHGYEIREGTSYNAFLVTGEQNILIDTVKAPFGDELLANISRIMDPKKIDAVISNHTEMDHSGSIPRVMHKIGEDKPLYCSKMGAQNLKNHFNRDYNFKVVGSGDTVTLGNRTFSFLETRMLHWPDSMFTYLPDEKILFSSDAFGQHYAGDQFFDDDIGDEIMPHARKYYANILLHFSPRVQALLSDVAKMNLDIRMICPDHGVIWRKDPSRIITAYDRWSRQEPVNKALVIFDSMWESTTKMARAVTSGIESEHVGVRLMNTRKCHRSDIMTEILDAGAVAVGSPTLNNGIFPVIADVLTYIKGLRPQNKIAAAFGSYGWSGEAVKIINKEFEEMKWEMVDPGVKVLYVPDEDDLNRCFELGATLAKKLKEKLNG
ncbi:FprA family A-type flavoprotein [Desulfotignum balticum]|jgi:flavorubredoxin|uniref:FprA family A-type flavoprotein n=1 Tax=Desulfotignum balticum TaxID=115781 RepID=UPI0004093C7D|nr:FprA family A-type flavoprotein [Desulfotignum balticum]